MSMVFIGLKSIHLEGTIMIEFQQNATLYIVDDVYGPLPTQAEIDTFDVVVKGCYLEINGAKKVITIVSDLRYEDVRDA